MARTIVGTKITFENEGDEGDRNTIAGDIVFIIRDKPHPIFERSNSDIIYRVKLTLKQALLGTLIIIPFLDSTKLPYQLHTYQEILTSQTEKRFPNEGLPYPKNPTKRGDLIVKFDILFPKFLNTEQRSLVDSCFPNSIDFYQLHDSVLHTTIIDQNQQQTFTSPPLQEQQQQRQQMSPSQHLFTSTPISTAAFKSQYSSINNNQKPPHRYFNSNGRHKSPASTSHNSYQNKSTSVRIPPPVPPRPSPTTLIGTHVNETVF
ncbi:unnamed protein product [Rotaria sp. Silwood1]|nr:unnamed protein product [Rotaria sp. Silwood1]